MVETMALLQCDASFLEGSYQVKLLRRYQDEVVTYVLLNESSSGYVDSKDNKEVVISAQTFEQWFTRLSKASVPVIIDGLQGCDGVTYKLNFYNGLNSSRYQWWMDAPESYRPLVDFANQLLEAVGHDDRLEVNDSI